MYNDPSGHFILSAILIGAAIGFASVYVPDVVSNIKENGFQLSDLLTINKDNWLEYAANTLGGALTGLIGGAGVSAFISAPMVGAINTGVEYLSGDISSWKEAGEYFAISTLISFMTLGSKNVSSKYKNPSIVKDIPTRGNKIFEKVIYGIEKGLYHYGQNADESVAITMILLGVI